MYSAYYFIFLVFLLSLIQTVKVDTLLLTRFTPKFVKNVLIDIEPLLSKVTY